MSDTTIEIRLHESLADIAAADWDACACPEGSARPIDPFTTHRFLLALEAPAGRPRHRLGAALPHRA